MYAVSCNADGLSGNCINTDTTKCSGSLFAGFCPGPDNCECCVTDFPSCTVDGTTGKCQATSSSCSGTYFAGYCPGPANVECCVAGAHEWNRSVCEEVALTWVKYQVKYSWTATALQWITHGQGKYRTDCSGFVSATWNVPPPGAVTSGFPCYQITEAELVRGDALLNPSEHVALFWGWDPYGKPQVIEECGHVPACCGKNATCPGACGTETNCDEYCPGCPIQVDTWDGYTGFYPCRRNGW